MDLNKEIKSLVDKLERERDELRVQAHLLGAEMRDEWEKAEGAWENLQNKSRHVAKAGRESTDDIADATKALVRELGEAYGRIRNAL